MVLAVLWTFMPITIAATVTTELTKKRLKNIIMNACRYPNKYRITKLNAI